MGGDCLNHLLHLQKDLVPQKGVPEGPPATDKFPKLTGGTTRLRAPSFENHVNKYVYN